MTQITILDYVSNQPYHPTVQIFDAVQNTHVQIIVNDALAGLRSLPDESVNCVVTSPPYWGLRSYLPGKVKLREDLPPEIQQRILSELESLGIEPIDHT
jgi:hypothetical protein